MNMKKMNDSFIKADKEHEWEVCRKRNTNGKRQKNKRQV